MEIKASEVIGILKKQIENFDDLPEFKEIGQVVRLPIHVPEKRKGRVGKLQFMESHCFGKLGRSYLRCLRKFVHSFIPMNNEDIKDIQQLINWVE